MGLPYLLLSQRCDLLACSKTVTDGYCLLSSLRRRFEQNQTDCTYTVLALLPTAAEDILEALPVEELTKELQKKRAERLARLNAGEGTGSDLSSVGPSITDDDRRSLSSFQSDGFVRTSQLGESTIEGSGSPRPKRNKTQLWNEVKITCQSPHIVTSLQEPRSLTDHHSYH